MNQQWIKMFALALALGVAQLSQAQTFPVRPISIIIPFPPGTALDLTARPVANEMSKRLGQPIILEFKPGANGTIGAKYVVSSKPDGYTLFYAATTGIHPIFNLNNAVDAATEMTPITQFITGPWVLFSRSSLPVNSFKELIEYAKSNPGKLKYGTPIATVDLAMAVLKARSGLSAESIPYKATGQVITAMLSDEVDITIGSPGTFVPHVQSGKFRPLFTAGPKRAFILPNVPTAAEAGLPSYDVALNLGLWGASGTPADIVQKLNAAAVAALGTAPVIEQIRTLGAEPVSTTPEQLLRLHDNEIKFWREAARIANFSPQ